MRLDNKKEESKGLLLLESLYDKCLDGIPKVSKPVSELADECIKKYGRTDKAIVKLVRNQLNKNSLNGFVTSFGGFITMTLLCLSTFTSVIYVQMRMVAAIALIRGDDLRDDEV